VLWERKHRSTKLDVHWKPQYDLCRPCHIKYDYVGYYETMHDDAKDVLQKIAPGSDLQVSQRDFDNPGLPSHAHLHLFENVSTTDIRQILDFYKNDYKVFGYKVPDAIRRRLDETRLWQLEVAT